MPHSTKRAHYLIPLVILVSFHIGQDQALSKGMTLTFQFTGTKGRVGLVNGANEGPGSRGSMIGEVNIGQAAEVGKGLKVWAGTIRDPYRGILRAEKESNEELGIPPEVVADYVHAVIEADRTSYTKHVERLQDEGVVLSEEDWKHRKALPLPAQLLLQAGTLVSERGGGIQYRLASLWPIYPRNGPATVLSRKD